MATSILNRLCLSVVLSLLLAFPALKSLAAGSSGGSLPKETAAAASADTAAPIVRFNEAVRWLRARPQA